MTPVLFAFAAIATLPAASLAPAAPERAAQVYLAAATQAGKLPSSEEHYKALKQQIERARPGVAAAGRKQAALQAQADGLRKRSVAIAAQIQSLERKQARIDSGAARLKAERAAIRRSFERDRSRLSHLLATLERLQSDEPPAIAFEPGDALRAARGAMLMGASLPRVYRAAAKLGKQLRALKRTEAGLAAQFARAAHNAGMLRAARVRLDRILAIEAEQAASAGVQYRALQAKLTAIANRAANLKALLDRVAALRIGATAQPGTVTVAAQISTAPNRRATDILQPPVVGRIAAPDPAEGANGARGVTFVAPPGAAVVAPADSEVLFAGPYHKVGKVLILEMARGYDLVLVGLGRLVVRPGDRLIAGEPVGAMPLTGKKARLYFEMRKNGKNADPARWLGADLRKAKKS